MPEVATLTGKLQLDITNYAKNLTKAAEMTNKFSKNTSGVINDGIITSVNKSIFKFKDVARIVQGIMLSKTFYSGVGAINTAATAVWDFTKELEYAKIAYSSLFGDTALAEEFINVLEDFAAKTPFSFQDAEASAKRLLAYGIEYKNVMYVMQGVLAASSMQNDPAKIEQISRAIGQIYTKGRLMNEEMRQLAEAGIPAYEILTEQLGVTQKQLQNLGNESIPASLAINALIDGMTERFGGVIEASADTTQGVISNIKDNATMLASGIFEPLTDNLRKSLSVFGEFLFSMRELESLGGFGTVFEELVPEGLQESLRFFAATLGATFSAAVNLASAFGTLLIPAVGGLMYALNIVLPVVAAVVNVFAGAIKIIMGNTVVISLMTAALTASAIAWTVVKTKAIAAFVIKHIADLITGSLVIMSAVLTSVARNPFWTIAIAGIGLLLGLAGGFDMVGAAIQNVGNSFLSLSGYDADKMFLPNQEERTSDLDKFNDSLSGTNDAMGDLADSTGNAANAAKGLLAFDEVFKLNEKDETAGDFDESVVPDFEIPIPSIPSPSIPDLMPFAINYVDNLMADLSSVLAAAMAGGAVGGLIGGMLFGPAGIGPGAGVGAAITVALTQMWDDITHTFKTMVLTSLAGIPVGALVGILTGAFTGPVGAAIGGVIGLVVGMITGAIAENWPKITAAFDKAVEFMGIFMSRLITTVKENVSGFIEGVQTFFTSLWTMIKQYGGIAITSIGDFFVGLYLSALTFFNNAIISISTFFSNMVQGIVNFIYSITETLLTFKNTITEGIKGVITWVSQTFSNFFGGIIEGVNGFITRVVDAFIGFILNIGTSLQEGFNNMATTISTGLTGMYENFTGWIGDLWDNVFGKLFGWLDDGIKKFQDFFGFSDDAIELKTSVNTGGSGTRYSTDYGHASGGIFNREHMANFAEGNKAEAIIPLENDSAMQPFVDAVAKGITTSLAPLLVSLIGGSSEELQPIYVGTLIADEQGLKELERKLKVVRVKEGKRTSNG